MRFCLLFFLLLGTCVAKAQTEWTLATSKPMHSPRIFTRMSSNGQHGISIGSLNQCAITRNGGKYWRPTRILNQGAKNGICAAFPTDSVGYVASERGPIKKTMDGGVTWINTPEGHSFMGMSFLTNTIGYGITQAWPQSVLRTIDGGLYLARFYPGEDQLIRKVILE